ERNTLEKHDIARGDPLDAASRYLDCVDLRLRPRAANSGKREQTGENLPLHVITPPSLATGGLPRSAVTPLDNMGQLPAAILARAICSQNRTAAEGHIEARGAAEVLGTASR